MWDRPSSTSQRQQEYATGTFVTSHPASQSYRDERGNSPSGSQWLVSKTVCKPRQTALLCSSYTQLTSKLLFLTQTTAARLYNQSWDWSTQQQHHMTIPGCPKHSVHAQPAAKRKMELCCETHWFLSVPLQASISIKGYSAKDDSYTRYYLSSLFQEFCPFFQGFPAKNQYNIPNGKAPFPISCNSVLWKSLNTAVWEEISLPKKVLKCGNFLQGKCCKWFYVTVPAELTYQQIKATVFFLRIYVVLVCRTGAKWVAHRKLIRGLFSKYSQMDIYLAENYMLSSGKVRHI